jgi:dihydrofolate reductase
VQNSGCVAAPQIVYAWGDFNFSPIFCSNAFLIYSWAAAGKEPTLTVTVFVGTSVDGFIARRNDDLDFLPPGGGEPHGYNEFLASVDAIVIGRKTFEKVLTFGAWPYGDKRVVVLSSRPLDFSAAVGGVVEQMAGSPAEIVSQLAASGAHHLYIDGGITIQRFLREGLIKRLIITRVPVLIGEGVPLFGALPHDIRLRHVATRHYPSGLVQSEYDIPS